MDVCMYACLFICTYVHILTYIYLSYRQMCVCVFMYHARTYVRMLAETGASCRRQQVLPCIAKPIIAASVSEYACMYVGRYVCMYTCT